MGLSACAAVEGVVDEVVLRRLVEGSGIDLVTVFGKQGKPALLRKLSSYNSAAVHGPWIVLIDLDNNAVCAPPAIAHWLPNGAPNRCCRVAVRAVEAWLMADRSRIAEFLGVPKVRIPTSPETVPDPKGRLVQLARSSRRREIRESFVPRGGSGAKVGPTYASSIMQFIEDKRAGWRPEEAAESSESLARCIKWLTNLSRRGRQSSSHPPYAEPQS